MAKPLFSNNAAGTLAGSYSAAATAISLTSGQGALFPSPSAGDWFHATIVDGSNNIEIVKVTARASDTFTVVRGQDGTTARTLSAGEKIELRVTKGVLEAVRDKVQEAADLATNSVVTAKIADDAVTAAKIADAAIDAAAKIVDGVITGAKLAVGAAVAALGFTPVRQGGGARQGTNTLYLGWTGTRVAAQVDAADIGDFLIFKDDGVMDKAGYRGLPQNQKEANYEFVLADAGKHILHTSGTHSYTVPDDSTDFQYGTPFFIVNLGGTVTITPDTGVTIRWLPDGLEGARTLPDNSCATLMKVGNNTWVIFGAGIT